jgi:PmbA protein
MDRLLALAKTYVDQVESYSMEKTQNTIIFEDKVLQDIQSTIQTGISIRLIKDRKLGFAYTRNLKGGESLIQHALDSLKGSVEVKYAFPLSKAVPELKTYDNEIGEATNTRIAEECKRIYSVLGQKTKGQINIDASTSIEKIKIMNSAGTDLTTHNSYYTITTEILYPGSASGIHRSFVFKAFQEIADADLNMLAELYNQGGKELDIPGARMHVLFMPETMYTLIWRLQSATSGESIYHKQSPLADRLGDQIFDRKLTVIDNPLDDTKPGARAFDDEGVKCRLCPIIEEGVLSHFYYDLNYASKMDVEPTGHGFRTTRWSEEAISTKPRPALKYISLESGDKTFWQLVKEMDKGIIICGALGAHSGNIPNGDFSIGLSPGLYVDKGNIVGRVKDAMVAGNIYDVMKRVSAIEDTIHPAYTGYYPAVLFDEISVATKG